MKKIIPFIILVGFIYGADTLYAASRKWKSPSGVPPKFNVAAPITTSTVNQVKTGVLGVNSLGVFGSTVVTNDKSYLQYKLPDTMKLGVNGDVGAARYCNENGENCVGLGGGSSGYINGCRTVVSPITGHWSEVHCSAGEVRTGGGCRSHGGAYQAHVYPVGEDGQGCASGSTGTYTEAFAVCCPTDVGAILKPDMKAGNSDACIEPSTWTWRSGCTAK
ncbi:MAG: hypothetical protein FGM57_01580 [Candidatus Taylorbacteria bacterium]|nr:hypothetical protein [Candidatus Taylorbacteria bacterium]